MENLVNKPFPLDSVKIASNNFHEILRQKIQVLNDLLKTYGKSLGFSGEDDKLFCICRFLEQEISEEQGRNQIKDKIHEF